MNEKIAGQKIENHFNQKGLNPSKTYDHIIIDHFGALLAATILQAHAPFSMVEERIIHRTSARKPLT